MEELEQQVLWLTRELEEARAIVTTPQSLLSEENKLMSEQLSEMTEEVKALGADLVRDLHPHYSFHEQIVTINNRL